MAPKTRICFICGRSYGLSSIDIHEKQCADLFNAQQLALPPNERKALPARPEVIFTGGSTAALLEAQNTAAAQTFNDSVMEACPNCGRTFIADRLKIHLRSCTKEHPASQVGQARLSEGSRSLLSNEVQSPKVQSKEALSQSLVAGHFGGAAGRESRKNLEESRGSNSSLPSSSEQRPENKALTPDRTPTKARVEPSQERVEALELRVKSLEDEVKDLRQMLMALTVNGSGPTPS